MHRKSGQNPTVRILIRRLLYPTLGRIVRAYLRQRRERIVNAYRELEGKFHTLVHN